MPNRIEEPLDIAAIHEHSEQTAERKTAEKVLRSSEARLTQILEGSPVATFVIDANHVITHWNRACRQLTGKSSKEMVGTRRQWEAFYPEKRPVLADLIVDGRVKKTIRNYYGNRSGPLTFIEGAYFAEDFFPQFDPGGRWLYFTAAPLKDDNGRLSGAIETLQDFTERKLAEKEKIQIQEQLRQVQKIEAVGTLAGGIAHDFNNILGGILGYTELLIEEIGDSEPNHRYYLDQIDQAANRAKRVVSQILEFSRQSRTAFRTFDVRRVAAEVLELLGATLPKTIAIDSRISPKPLWIKGDPTQVHQVIMNLCTNAYHAVGNRAGTLTLSLVPMTLERPVQTRFCRLAPGRYLELAVVDTGCGIDPSHLDKIFDPYFSTKQRGEGTGLGLSVTMGIVKSHGGGFSVESRPGKGSRFQVFLPLIEPQTAEVPSHPDSLPGGKERILFVDDEAYFLEIVQRQLEAMGYRVTALSNAPQALRVFQDRADDFDLVITDQTMPHMTGVELAAAIGKVRPEIPIILCTGFSEVVDERTAPKFGIAKFVMKPASKRQLALAIREALD